MEFVNEKLQEFERYIKGKNVAVIGLEKSCLPLLDYFCNKKANVTVFDNRTIDDIDKIILDKVTERCIQFSFGKHSLVNLLGFDIIFKAPFCRNDIPEVEAEGVRGAFITSERELLLELCPGTIIGVAGDEGVSTTAGLIYNILKENRNDCFLCSNSDEIESVFDKIGGMTTNSIVVMEFMDNQLSEIKSSPNISVLTHVKNSDESVEVNGNVTFQSYIENLKKIFKFQSEDGLVIMDFEGASNKYLLPDIPGKVRYYSVNDKLDNGVIFDNWVIKNCEDGVRRHIVTIDDAISLSGTQNYKNICAAVLATDNIASPHIQSRAIIKFKDLGGI